MMKLLRLTSISSMLNSLQMIAMFSSSITMLDEDSILMTMMVYGQSNRIVINTIISIGFALTLL